MDLRPPIIPSSIREGQWRPHIDHCVVRSFSHQPPTLFLSLSSLRAGDRGMLLFLLFILILHLRSRLIMLIM
jgi:hypothetical protein